MRALVIGATGFIGTRVAEELTLRHHVQVRATVRDYRRAIRLARLPIEWVDDPASDAAAMQRAAARCDFVVVCAHPFSAANEKEAALGICRAAAAAAATTATRRLVFVSSTAVYGSSHPHIDDRTVPRPATPYGRIKLACERLLARGHDAGTIRLVVLRPSIVYGPFSPSWTVLPARQLHDGVLVLPETASGACNAIYVDDVARAAALAALVDSPLALNLNADDRPTWRAFYGCYERVVRPGSVSEWPLDRVRRALAARDRERRTIPAVGRALRDRSVRDRLNEIPVLAGLNSFGKSIGWRGLPPADHPASTEHDSSDAARVEHLPDAVRLDLYLRAPSVDGQTAVRVLGVRPRPLEAGMVSTGAWLRWAGLAAAAEQEAFTA